jgi:excinuclease ABC subunit C
VRRRALLAHVRAGAEQRPAVYRVIGETGSVIYVGKSRQLRARLLSYFRAKGRRSKQAKIMRQAHGIEWEYCHSEFAALLLELRLIKRFRPRHNRALNVDEFPRAWIALSGGEVPGLSVVFRSDDPDATLLYGPFRRAGMLGEAVRALAEATGVRDCALARRSLSLHDASAVHERVSRRTPGCLRVELGSCPGPCVGAASSADYAARVAVARDFLAGRDASPVATLRAEMERASSAWHFERAGALKSKVERLEWLASRLARFHAGADRLTFRYHSVGHDGTERVYLIRRGTVRADLPLPTDTESAAALEQLATRIFDGPDLSGADIPVHDLEEFYLVASWFRNRAEERGRTRK